VRKAVVNGNGHRGTDEEGFGGMGGKSLGCHDIESSPFNRRTVRWCRRAKVRVRDRQSISVRVRDSAGKRRGTSWWEARRPDRSRSRSNSRERLSNRDARGGSRKDVIRMRWFLADMRFVSKEVLEKDDGSTGGVVLRTCLEEMIDGATAHTAGKSKRKCTLKISGRVNRIDRGSAGLVALHGCLGGGSEGTNWVKAKGRGTRRNRRTGRRPNSRGSDNKRGSKGGGRALPELAMDSFGDEAFLIAEDGMIANSSNTKGAKGIDLQGS
jgi:hypothetical protein